MNYAQTAQNIASKGRYGDSMLVHMTPREIGGLQALARKNGTSLTINPNTGLPEAFSLRAILPMIAGAGLTAVSGGALSPLTIGLMTGGLGALATGSLKEGLMMGLGAAGGSGMAGSFANLAAPAAAAAPTAAAAAAPTVAPITEAIASQAAPAAMSFPVSTGAAEIASIPGSDLAGGFADGISQGAQLAPPATPMDIGFGPGQYGPMTSPADISGMGADEFRRQGLAGGFAPSNPVTFGNIGEGFGQAFSDSESAGKFLGSNKMNLAMSAAPLLAGEPMDIPGSEQFIRPFSLDIDNTSGQDPYAPGSTQEREQLRYRYTPQPIYRAAQGGIVAFANGGETVNSPFTQGIASFREGKEVRKKLDRTSDPYDFADYRSGRGLYEAAMKNFAEGGMNTPRFLSGGGDGMSDSIPATIGDRQPARLADGEFVVPADVVSHLGNGSSKAGAKQLHKMMDRIRQGRTGKKGQAPEVNPRKFMPA
jgi:hypothetical protein